MEQEMEIIQKYLENARDFNMLNEVIYTALKTMKENPNLSIEEVLIAGCDEWDV